MRTRVWCMGLVLASLGVGCGDQPTEVVPERELTGGSGMIAAGAAANLTGEATVATDKDDYVPREPVTMTGSGFEPGETVTLTLTEDPAGCRPRTFTVVADSLGNFIFDQWAPEDHDAGVAFILTAVGQSSGLQAETRFTDSIALGAVATNLNAGSSASSRQITVGAPAGITAGDVLVAQITVTNGMPATNLICPPTGWTSAIRTNTSGTSTAQQIFYRVAGSSEPPSYQWTFRTNCSSAGTDLVDKGAAGAIIRYTGVNTTTPLDVAPIGSSGTGTTATAQAVTVTAGAMAIRFFGIERNTDINPIPGRLYFTGSGANGQKAIAGYQAAQASAGSTGDVSATFASATWLAQTVALRMACTPVSISGQPVSASKTIGESVTFSVTAAGDGLTYQWRKGGAAISGANAASYTIQSVALADAGSYDVVITGDCGSATSDAAVLTVTQRSTTTSLSASPTPSTFGQSVTFEATVTPTTGSGPTGDVAFIEGGSCASPVTVHESVSLTAGKASFSTSTLSVGDHTILACYAGDTQFAGSIDEVTHTVEKANQTITFGVLANKTYGDPPFGLTANASSGLAVSFALGSGSVGCSVAGTTVTITAATGSGQHCIIVASQAGNGNFNPAPNVTRQFEIARADLSISVADKTRKYGQPNPTLTGTLTGVVYNDDIIAVYATTATQSSDVGKYPITVTLNDPDSKLGNYNVPSPLPQGELDITPADLTVTAEDKQKDYNGQPFSPFTVKYDGFVLGQDEGVLGGSLGFTGSAVAAVNAGSYTITPGGLESHNYKITFENGTLTIKKVGLTVTAVDRQKGFDGLPYPFNPNKVTTTDVTYAGFVTGEGPSVLTGSLNFSAAGATAVGTYTNEPSGLDATNYEIGYVAGTLRILQWTVRGFYQPVDMSGPSGVVWNTVRGGATVPLKFNIYQATTADPTKERTDVGAVQSFKATAVTCYGNTADAIEVTTTGGTVLRYDTTDRQFIQNWQTPKSAGACYLVTMTALDATSKVEAYFKLK